MTEQEAFDIVFRGLEAQEWMQSRDNHQNCQFRGVEGRKCAIGFLIPDEMYTPKMEVTALESIRFDIPGLLSVDINLLCRMQSAHDTAGGDFGPTMREQFIEIAKEFDLTVPD